MKAKLVKENIENLFQPKSQSEIDKTLKILGPFKDVLQGILSQPDWVVNFYGFEEAAQETVDRPTQKGLSPLYYMRWSPYFAIQFIVPKDINTLADEYSIDYFYEENVTSMDIYANQRKSRLGLWTGGLYLEHPLNFTTFKELKKFTDFMKGFESTPQSIRSLNAKTGILTTKKIKTPYN